MLRYDLSLTLRALLYFFSLFDRVGVPADEALVSIYFLKGLSAFGTPCAESSFEGDDSKENTPVAGDELFEGRR